MQLSGIMAACGMVLVNPTLSVLALSAVSVTCFALATQAEDRFNVAKFGEPYRIYWFKGSHKLRLNTGAEVDLSRAQVRALRKILRW
jgi:hypothetical protein